MQEATTGNSLESQAKGRQKRPSTWVRHELDVVRLWLKVPESNTCEALEEKEKVALWCRCRSRNQAPAEQKAQVLGVIEAALILC